jgi:hypothetical protein
VFPPAIHVKDDASSSRGERPRAVHHSSGSRDLLVFRNNESKDL